jgi:ankyrin repeat protein
MNVVQPTPFSEYTCDVEKLRHALQMGADVNGKDEEGMTALIRASRDGKDDCVSLLLKQDNVDVNATCDCGRTALIWACIEGHSKFVSCRITRM